MSKNNTLQPTPTDFSSFVFCGVKWILGHFDSSTRVTPRSQKAYNLMLGQQNEHKCVEFLLNRYSASNDNIVFNGTNDSEQGLLTCSIGPTGFKMQCKPDLILNIDSYTALFEFKAVSDLDYLSMSEFDSDHAQVWCYTYLETFRRFDYYFLFRYFIAPGKIKRGILSYKQDSYRFKKLTPKELDDFKFSRLFEQYVNLTHEINEIKNVNKRKNREQMLSLIEQLKSEHSPKDSMDINNKCTNCYYKIYNQRCPVYHA